MSFIQVAKFTLTEQLTKTENVSKDINKNVTLAYVKQYLKIVSGIIKSGSAPLNMKMIRNYQKNVGKSKSTMKNKNLHGKLSEYVVLKIQTVIAAFYF